jgi:CheY-like chemotaxis protein
LVSQGELAIAQRERPQTVLLVEDEILIRMDLAESLRDQGWEVIEAGTAVDALDLLRLIVVDIVVTDVHMPGGMTGIDLARSIRDGWPDLPVVVMSGLHRPQDEEGRYFDAFQSKPVANIASVVEAVLARKRS